MSVKWMPLWIFVPLLCAKADCGAQKVFTQVNDLLRNRQYQAAARTLDGLKHCALDPLDRFQSGWLYGRARNFTAALEAFNAVPGNVPDLVTHKYAIALSEFELADYRAASDVLKTLQSQAEFDTKCANLLAVSYSKLALYRDAYLVLAQDIRNHPDDLPAYLNMVTVCAEGGNIAKAAEVASEASRVFPQSQEVFVVRGAANMLLGHATEAGEDFSTAARIAPQAAEPRFFLALTQYKLGKYADAVNVLQSAIRDGIADPDVHYLMAECLLKLNPADTQKAIGQLNRAIELNANSVSARTLRGRLFLETGQPKAAVADLQLANRLDATSRSAAYNLARAYRAEGRTADAESLFKRLRSEPGDTLMELGDKRLNQALTQSPAGDPQ